MSIYAFIGILRCPYRSTCPDPDFEDEVKGAEKNCLTHRHYGCEAFKAFEAQRKKEEERIKYYQSYL
jgi:hypothetical protein